MIRTLLYGVSFFTFFCSSLIWICARRIIYAEYIYTVLTWAKVWTQRVSTTYFYYYTHWNFYVDFILQNHVKAGSLIFVNTLCASFSDQLPINFLGFLFVNVDKLTKYTKISAYVYDMHAYRADRYLNNIRQLGTCSSQVIIPVSIRSPPSPAIPFSAYPSAFPSGPSPFSEYLSLASLCHSTCIWKYYADS